MRVDASVPECNLSKTAEDCPEQNRDFATLTRILRMLARLQNDSFAHVTTFSQLWSETR